MASTFLTHLRVGGKLVNARGVHQLYQSRISGWALVALVLAAAFTIAIAIAYSPVGPILGDCDHRHLAHLRLLVHWTVQVIDFRYHLVSIIAVFLALAIGIVLGSTELQGNTIDVLRTSSNLLKNELDPVQRGAQHRHPGAQQQASRSSSTAQPRLLANELPGQQDRARDRARRLVGGDLRGPAGSQGGAGATVTGTVAIQPKFNDLSGTNQASLSTDQLRSVVDRRHAAGHALQRAERSTSSRPRS